MTVAPEAAQAEPFRGGIFTTAWPRIFPEDSEVQRRRKRAIRAGHLAMACMLTTALGGPLWRDPQAYSAGQTVGLILASLLYLGWNLAGTRGSVILTLSNQDVPLPLETRVPRIGAVPYFAIQLALAAAVYLIADRGLVPNLVWLVLLPPVAYAVFMLETPGIVVVSLLTMAILTGSAYRWHGGAAAGFAALSFSFAIVFTLVFTLLAVHSEKARMDIQRLAGELGNANRQLREYALRVEELAATRERNRIAREIHDSLGHYLTAVNMQLEAARTLEASDPVRAHEAVAKAQSFTQEGLRDIRRSLAALRASPLDNRSLADGLRELVNQNHSPEIQTEFLVIGSPRPLPSPTELSLYRAVQEGLTNVRKHAQAKQVVVSLEYQTNQWVRVMVQDNGVGLPEVNPAPDNSGFGLLGLRERTQLLRGVVRLESPPGAGCTLTVEVPG